MGDNQSAIRHFDEVIQMDPQLGVAYLTRVQGVGATLSVVGGVGQRGVQAPRAHVRCRAQGLRPGALPRR
eukprot:3789127-Rhodomonas_salina.1